MSNFLIDSDFTMLHDQDPEYRPNVGLMILNKNKEIFIAKRLDFKNAAPDALVWQMPQGGIDYGENPYQAALREMREEIGTDKVTLLAESHEWIRYDLPPHLAHKLWGGRYLGQKQKWYLFRFEGDDRDINLKTSHPEFCEWVWARPAQVLACSVEFKREVYQHLIREFQSYLTEGSHHD